MMHRRELLVWMAAGMMACGSVMLALAPQQSHEYPRLFPPPAPMVMVTELYWVSAVPSSGSHWAERPRWIVADTIVQVESGINGTVILTRDPYRMAIHVEGEPAEWALKLAEVCGRELAEIP